MAMAVVAAAAAGAATAVAAAAGARGSAEETKGLFAAARRGASFFVHNFAPTMVATSVRGVPAAVT